MFRLLNLFFLLFLMFGCSSSDIRETLYFSDYNLQIISPKDQYNVLLKYQLNKTNNKMTQIPITFKDRSQG